MGRQALLNHIKGKKHKEISKLCESFFKVAPSKSNTTETVEKKHLSK